MFTKFFNTFLVSEISGLVELYINSLIFKIKYSYSTDSKVLLSVWIIWNGYL